MGALFEKQTIRTVFVPMCKKRGKVPKFRKKPVVIEARQTGQDYDEDCSILEWCGGVLFNEEANTDSLFRILTLEGDLEVTSGDWVIKGTAGEFYPCKPEIFKDIYEAVDSSG
jgi:hypothetical protein